MIPMLIVLGVVMAAGTSGAAGAAEQTASNFERCRDGVLGCDITVLSDDERRTVEAFELGRNFRDCIDEKASCDQTRLTWEQAAALVAVHQTRVASRTASLEAAKASARNLSACVYGESSCDMSKLTREQLATMRDAVEQHATFKALDRQRIVASNPEPTVPVLQLPQQPTRPSRGQRFLSGFLDLLGAAVHAYVEIESARAASAAETPIVVSSGGTVVVQNNSAVVGPSQSVIESRIDGAFEGWTGNTIFKLQNGQIWQQVNYTYKYKYLYAPTVTIYRSGSKYKMVVDKTGDSIEVRRLR